MPRAVTPEDECRRRSPRTKSLLGLACPLLREGTKSGFDEFSERAENYALATALTLYRIESGVIGDCKVSVGRSQDGVWRINETADLLNGGSAVRHRFKDVANPAATFDFMKTLDTAAAINATWFALLFCERSKRQQ